MGGRLLCGCLQATKGGTHLSGGVDDRELDAATLSDLGEMFVHMIELHPTEAHWYLPVTGVDPAAQGRGMGTTVLRYGLALADRDGVHVLRGIVAEEPGALHTIGFRNDGRNSGGIVAAGLGDDQAAGDRWCARIARTPLGRLTESSRAVTGKPDSIELASRSMASNESPTLLSS